MLAGASPYIADHTASSALTRIDKNAPNKWPLRDLAARSVRMCVPTGPGGWTRKSFAMTCSPTKRHFQTCYEIKFTGVEEKKNVSEIFKMTLGDEA